MNNPGAWAHPSRGLLTVMECQVSTTLPYEVLYCSKVHIWVQNLDSQSALKTSRSLTARGTLTRLLQAARLAPPCRAEGPGVLPHGICNVCLGRSTSSDGSALPEDAL